MSGTRHLTVDLKKVELVFECSTPGCEAAYVVGNPHAKAFVPVCFNCSQGQLITDARRTEILTHYRQLLRAATTSDDQGPRVRLRVPVE